MNTIFTPTFIQVTFKALERVCEECAEEELLHSIYTTVACSYLSGASWVDKDKISTNQTNSHAVQLLQVAEKVGDTAAVQMLAMCFHCGVGVCKNNAKAKELLETFALRGM